MHCGKFISATRNIFIASSSSLSFFFFSHVNLAHFLNSLPVHRHSWNTKIFNEKCPLMMSSNTWTGQSGHFVFRASFHSPKQPNSKAKMLSSVTSQLDVITATGVVEVARIKDSSPEERLAMFRYQFLEEQLHYDCTWKW